MPPSPATCRPAPAVLLSLCRRFLVQARLSKLRDAETGDLQERAELQDALIKSEEMRLSLARLLIDAQVCIVLMRVLAQICTAQSPSCYPVPGCCAPTRWTPMTKRVCGPQRGWTWRSASRRWRPGERVGEAGWRARGPSWGWTWRSASQRWRPGECVSVCVSGEGGGRGRGHKPPP